METQKKTLMDVLVHFLDKLVTLIFAPFRLDKLCALASVALIASPTIFDFKGTFNINNDSVDGQIAISNSVDIASYIVGGLLMIVSVYFYHKREVSPGNQSDNHRLIDLIKKESVEKKGYYNLEIQHVFKSLFGRLASVDKIMYMILSNDPDLAIRDYCNAFKHVTFSNGFSVKRSVDLDKIKSTGSWGYFICFGIAFLFYVIFIYQINKGNEHAIFLLVPTIIFAFSGYQFLKYSASAYSAERLKELGKSEVDESQRPTIMNDVGKGADEGSIPPV